MSFPKHHHILPYLREHKVARLTLGYVVVMTVFSAVLAGGILAPQLSHAFAASCPQGDKAYNVLPGDTLGSIADHNNMTLQTLASHNKIVDADLIYVAQLICIPQDPQGSTITTAPQGDPMGGVAPIMTSDMTLTTANAIKGGNNPYPYGQCTWWASQRYSQIHGFFVPWTSNSNAWQWVARAHDNRWKVDARAKVGAIVVLQPWVQGAHELGHVAIVEKVLSNGHVMASNMNWGGAHAVVNVEFAPGAGVAFVSAA